MYFRCVSIFINIFVVLNAEYQLSKLSVKIHENDFNLNLTLLLVLTCDILRLIEQDYSHWIKVELFIPVMVKEMTTYGIYTRLSKEINLHTRR